MEIEVSEMALSLFPKLRLPASFYCSEAEGLVSVDHASELTADLLGKLIKFMRLCGRQVFTCLCRFKPMQSFLKFSIGVGEF